MAISYVLFSQEGREKGDQIRLAIALLSSAE